jgi:hypothetical protein
MSRIYGRISLLAGALLVGACVSLLGLAGATAQDPANCPNGACLGAGGGPVARLADKHNNDIMNCRPRTYGQPELFYNYYVPDTCGGVPAAMYLAPQPVPAWVGHTYYTYQPVLPHELLYQHHRTYYRYYDQGRGLTRTHISWTRPPLSTLPAYLRIPR